MIKVLLMFKVRIIKNCLFSGCDVSMQKNIGEEYSIRSLFFPICIFIVFIFFTATVCFMLADK